MTAQHPATQVVLNHEHALQSDGWDGRLQSRVRAPQELQAARAPAANHGVAAGATYASAAHSQRIDRAAVAVCLCAHHVRR